MLLVTGNKLLLSRAPSVNLLIPKKEAVKGKE